MVVCRYHPKCNLILDARHTSEYEHPRTPCVFAKCNRRGDATHEATYSHPSNTPSNQSSTQTSTSVHRVVPPCRFGDRCLLHDDANHRSRFSHPPVVAATPVSIPLPDNVVRVGNDHVHVDDLRDTEGKRQLLERPTTAGTWCNFAPCRYGARCRNIHRAQTAEERAFFSPAERSSEQSDSSATSPVSNARPHDATQGVVECPICASSVGPESLFRCSRNHVICNDCFSDFILQTWAGREVLPGAIAELRCTEPDCTSPPLAPRQVALHATAAACETYFEVVQRSRDAVVLAKSMKLVEDAKAAMKQKADATRSEAEKALLQSYLQQQIPNALMCPRCDFGPIDRTGCDNLQQHHHQQVGQTRIDNRCPRCRFFAAHVNEWKRWDGVLRDGTTTAARTTAPGTPSASRLHVRPVVARQVDSPPARAYSSLLIERLVATTRCTPQEAVDAMERTRGNPDEAALLILSRRRPHPPH